MRQNARKTRMRAVWVSLTPERGRGKLEKGGSVPGVALASGPMQGPATTQRPGPRQDTESQKVNPFIPKAQRELLKNPRHLLGSLRFQLLIKVTTHPCLLSILMSNASFHSQKHPSCLQPTGPFLKCRASLCWRWRSSDKNPICTS